MIGKAGGFVSAIFRTFVVVVAFVNHTNINSKLMYLIFKKKAHLGQKDTNTKNNIYEI